MSEERISCHLEGVSWRYDGATVAADAAAGDLALTVDTLVDLAEPGGTLLVPDNGAEDGWTEVRYAALDDDTDTALTLTDPLPVDLEDGDEVRLLNTVTGEAIAELEALVSIDDADDDDGDPIPATVAEGLVKRLPDDLDSLVGLACRCEVDDAGDLEVVHLPGFGKARDGGAPRGYQDTVVVAGPVDTYVSLPLTFRAIGETTLHVYWNGLFLHDDEWTYDGDWLVTIGDPDGLARVGDEFEAKYLYDDATTGPVPEVEEPSLTFVDFTSFGGDDETSLALPTGTDEGDLLVLVLMDYRPGYAPLCADDRFADHQESYFNDTGLGGTADNDGALFAYGLADGTSDPVTFDVGGDRATGILAAFHYAGALAHEFTGLRDAVADSHVYEVTPPSGASHSIALLAGARGVVGHGFDDDDNLLYTTVEESASTTLSVPHALIAYSPTGGVGSFSGLSTPSIWGAMTIGVSLSVPLGDGETPTVGTVGGGGTPGGGGGSDLLGQYTADAFLYSTDKGDVDDDATTAMREFLNTSPEQQTSGRDWPALTGVEGNAWGMAYRESEDTDPIWTFQATGLGVIPSQMRWLTTQGIHIPEGFEDSITGTTDSPMVILDRTTGVTVWASKVKKGTGNVILVGGSAGGFWHGSNGLDGRRAESDDVRNFRSRGAIPDAMLIRKDLLDEAVATSGTLGHVLHLFWAASDGSGNPLYPMVGSEARNGWGREGQRISIDDSVDISARTGSAYAKAIARTLQTHGAYIGDNAGRIGTAIKLEQDRPGHDVWSSSITVDELEGLITWDDFVAHVTPS